MDANDYQRQAIVTDGTTSTADRLANAVLGLAGEAGELAQELIAAGWSGTEAVREALGHIALFGEAIDRIKKVAYHGHSPDFEQLAHAIHDVQHHMRGWYAGENQLELRRASLIGLKEHVFADELGDAQWYIGQAATGIGWDLGIVMGGNLKKLRERYPNGFSSERSQRRAPTPSPEEQLLERVVDTYYKTIKPKQARWVIGHSIFPRLKWLKTVNGQWLIQTGEDDKPDTLMGLSYRIDSDRPEVLGIENGEPATRKEEHRKPFPPNITVEGDELVVSWKAQPWLGYQVEVQKYDGGSWVHGTTDGHVRYSPANAVLSKSPPMAVRLRSILRSDLSSLGPWSEWTAVPQPKAHEPTTPELKPAPLMPAPQVQWDREWLHVTWPSSPDARFDEMLVRWANGSMQVQRGAYGIGAVNLSELPSPITQVAYRYVYADDSRSLWSEMAEVPPVPIQGNSFTDLRRDLSSIVAGVIRPIHISSSGQTTVERINLSPLQEFGNAATGIFTAAPPTTPERWIVTADKLDLRATVRHTAEDSAVKEAQRLATGNPGAFQVWKLVGSWQRSTPPLVWHQASSDAAEPPSTPKATNARVPDNSQPDDELPF